VPVNSNVTWCPPPHSTELRLGGRHKKQPIAFENWQVLTAISMRMAGLISQTDKWGDRASLRPQWKLLEENRRPRGPARKMICSKFSNDGGNPAGQQLVGNSDPFRVETSFPEAPWKLHQERDEDVEGRTGTQEVITICIEIGLTSASTPSPLCPEPDWT
ncbi:hypothetical protein KUCAC02_029129, partial [Chaenocephalus aceratus]